MATGSCTFHQDPSLFKLLRLYKIWHAAFHQDPDLFKLLRLCKSWALCKFSIFGRPLLLMMLVIRLFPFHPLIPLSWCTSAALMEPLAQFSDTTPSIRCTSPMSSISRLSHPFHPVPRNWEFVAAAYLFEFVFGLYNCTI